MEMDTTNIVMLINDFLIKLTLKIRYCGAQICAPLF